MSCLRRVTMLVGTLAVAAALLTTASSVSATCPSKVAPPAQGEQGELLPIRYVACQRGSHRFQLIYLSGSPHPRTPGGSAGHRTVTVKTPGSATYKWVLGAISRGRYRVTMKLPNGKTIKSRHTVLIVCNEARKAQPETFDC
ncbi:MAG: hypothetical protein WKF96_23900 [Solirubrobacteraceae bacterium]